MKKITFALKAFTFAAFISLAVTFLAYNCNPYVYKGESDYYYKKFHKFASCKELEQERRHCWIIKKKFKDANMNFYYCETCRSREKTIYICLASAFAAGMILLYTINKKK